MSNALVPAHATKHTAAVVLADPHEHALGLHVGILYRTGGKKRVIHLAEDAKLADEAVLAQVWQAVVPEVDAIELQVLAGLCVRRSKVPAQDIPWGFVYKESRLSDEGTFVAGPGETGLMCGTFVMAMFRWAKIALLDDDSWKSRPADATFFRRIAGSQRKNPEREKALLREASTVRFRPEEVAAGSGFSSRPVGFELAAAAGEELSEAFYTGQAASAK